MGFSAVILLRATESPISVRLHEFEGDPVSLFWMVPITEAELTRAEAEGSEALLGELALPRET